MGATATLAVPAVYGMGRQIYSDIKGGSPQERSSADFASRVGNLTQGVRGQGTRRFQGQIQPFFDQARADLTGLEGTLAQILGVNQAAIGNQLGDALAGAGVARGHDQSGAFVSAMAPAIAQHLQGVGQVGQMRTGVSMQEANTLAQLLSQEDALLSQLLGLELGGISGMKGSTATGDIFGLLQTLGTTAGPFLEDVDWSRVAEWFQRNQGGGGSGGQPVPAAAGLPA